MNILSESLQLPSRLLSLIPMHDIRDHFENSNISDIKCEQVLTSEDLKKYYQEGKELLIICLWSDELIVRWVNKSRTEEYEINRMSKNFIDAYVFSNIKNTSDLKLQRHFNKEGERRNLRQLNKHHFQYDHNRDEYTGEYTGYHETREDGKNIVLDRSGYVVDFEKYIKKLNDIKRISGNFEKKLLSLQNQYIDLLEEIYKADIKAQRQATVVKSKIDTYEIKDLSSEIKNILSDIVSKYKAYIDNKRYYKRSKDEYEANPKDIQLRSSFESQKKILDKNEKDITNALNGLQSRLVDMKTRWFEINDSKSDIEESKKTFKRVFEAVSGPKKLLEYGDWVVYTKPFSKVTIQLLSHVDRWSVPTKFNNFDYMIVNKTKEGYLFVGDKQNYDYEDRYFYDQTEDLVEVVYQIFGNYNFEDFAKQRFVNRHSNWAIKYVDTKEKAIQVLEGSWQTRSFSEELIKSDKFDSLKFTDEDIARIITYSSSDVIKAFNDKGLINSKVISLLKVKNPSDYYSSITTLFREVLSEEQIKKFIKSINPDTNKNLLTYLLVVCNIGSYLTEEQITTLFRQKLDFGRGINSTLRENILDILKTHKLPKDVTNKMLLLANDKLNIETSVNHLSDIEFKDMSNMSADKIYRLMLSNPEIVKKALKDGMKIPEYMIEPIKRSLKLHGKTSLLSKFNSIYSK